MRSSHARLSKGAAPIEIGAATKADLIVVIDGDARMRSFVETLCATLLTVDAQAKTHNWDARQTAQELRRRFSLEYPVGRLWAEMKAAGIPEDASIMNTDAIQAMRRSLKMSRDDTPGAPDNWLTCEEAPGHVAHLMALAKEGKIRTMQADCSDPVALKKIASCAASENVTVSACYLSNIFHYPTSAGLVAAAFRQLPLSKNAVVVTTGSISDGSPGAASFGSFFKPAVHGATRWIEPGGVAEQDERAIFQDRPRASMFFSEMLSARGIVPRNEEDFQRLLDALPLSREQKASLRKEAQHFSLQALSKHVYPRSYAQCVEWIDRLARVAGSTVDTR